MKILIYDNNPADLSKLCAMIETLPIDFLIDKVSHYNDCIELYGKYSYDMVFIDFADNIGKNILSYILEKNPKQKVVTMSDIDNCSEKQGCDFCVTTYNKKRVTKPIQGIDLIKILSKNEQCKLYCNNDLLIKLEIFSKGLNYLTFDREQFIFTKNEQSYHKEMVDIIRLCDTLTEAKINFAIIENGVKIITNR
jgi:hypothetical protein